MRAMWTRISSSEAPRCLRLPLLVLVVFALSARAAPLRAAGFALRLSTTLAPSRSSAPPRTGASAQARNDEGLALRLAPELGAQNSPPAAPLEELLLLVDVNQQHLNETSLFLKAANGDLFASAADLQRWRLRAPLVAPLFHDRRPYFNLKAIRGLTYRLDEASQAVAIQAPPQAFAATAITRSPSAGPAPTVPQLGAFANYDFVATREPGLVQRSGLLELGAFGQSGVVIGDFLAQDTGLGLHVTRLDTTWTKDRPDSLASLRLGDAISNPGSWGQSVRFGGIQYATNFATQPNLVTFPLQSVSGQAVLPSTVDLYVNNARVASQNVAPGPFTISNVPVIAGSGTVTMVVRDALGREQLVTSPFYASPALLREGLRDFSYEAGFVREDYGLASDQYGPWLGSGTYRVGLTDGLTGEWHGELMQNQATTGVGAAFLVPRLGVVSGSLAGSTSAEGLGALAAFGVEHIASPFSFSGHAQFTSSRFTQIGLQPGAMAPIQVSNLNLGYAMRGGGTIGVSYTVLADRGQPRTDLLSATYGLDLGRFGQLGVSALGSFGGDSSRSLFVTWTLALDNRTTASLARSTQGGASQWSAALQRGLPAGTGYGYNLQATDAGQQIAELDMQNSVGTYSVQAAQLQGQTSEQVSASGGIALLGDHLLFSRQLDDSFGLVEVPGYPGVRVYADNQLVGRTDARGDAMIPVLRPYQDNRISIEQLDLPLNAKVDSLTLDAVPYYRSGVLLKFPVQASRGALFKVRLQDGKPLPAGATVRLNGRKEAFPVGLDGEVYVTGLQPSNRVHATWRGQGCNFEVAFPKTSDPLPKLGTFACKGVLP
ncbi:MAG TPA: fimbria/pilus outer membrane usher protein [Burkholderiales bacterium]|nr:fimbria/pilus outer membrane usher protein [Burkholderiales bacterium]